MFIETDPEMFAALARDAKLSHKFGACVDVYEPGEYNVMTCYTSQDGGAGFAVKRTGEIVSCFSAKGSGVTAGDLLFASVEMGGWRLDCFDTVLPDLYRAGGFVEVSRCGFDDEFAPEGWDFDTYAQFNNGRPDVVFMVHESHTFGPVPTMIAADYDTAAQWAASFA